MERGERLLRVILTAAVFVLAAYAFSVIWSPENVARLFERRDVRSTEGDDVRSSGDPIGPPPIITFDAMQHILERHVDEKSFPEKSKFIEDIDIPDMIETVYFDRDIVRHEEDKYIYEYKSENIVGTRGQRCVRLVTADDGTVITFYALGQIDETCNEAA
jgi:hypothetical protein